MPKHKNERKYTVVEQHRHNVAKAGVIYRCRQGHNALMVLTCYPVQTLNRHTLYRDMMCACKLRKPGGELAVKVFLYKNLVFVPVTAFYLMKTALA